MADRPPGRHAEGGSPVQGNRLHTTTSPSQQGPDAASVLAVALEHAERGWPVPPAQVIRAGLLALSDERDLWLRWVLAAWREGHAAGRDSMDDAVTTAYIDGLLRRKGIEHDHIRALTGGTDRVDLWQDQQRRTWGPGGREHFADPRPGEYTGGPVEWNAGGQR